MSDNISKLDLNLSMNDIDIEHLINTFIFHLKSNKDAEKKNKQNIEEALFGIKGTIEKLFKKTETDISNLSDNLNSTMLFNDKTFCSLTNLIEKQNIVITEYFSMLENKMSKFDVRINMLDKKFDFIIEKLAPEALPINLQRCEDKLVIQDNVDNDEKLKNNVNLLKHETIIGKVTQHFSNPCADMEYEKIGSDSENYYDIPDEFEKQHVINLESLKNNVHDSVSNNHEKLSVSKGRDVLNLTIEEDVLSSSSSVIDESEKTRVKIKPVENFHFKPVDNNINGNYIMDTIITEKNFQHNEYNNNCEKKAIGVNEEYRKPVEMHKNSHSNILWESDTPCLLFCHSSENNKFNLMGDTKCKIISSVSNDYYTLVFSGLIPDNLLLAVKLDENIDFKIMGENHVMFKFIHFDEKCEEVKNHCIEFKSREYVDEFIKVICNLCG